MGDLKPGQITIEEARALMTPEDHAVADMFWQIFASARRDWLDYLDEKYPLAAIEEDEAHPATDEASERRERERWIR